MGKGDKTLVHGGVAREHDRPIRCVEAIRQGGDSPTVCHGNGTHPDCSVFEYEICNSCYNPG